MTVSVLKFYCDEDEGTLLTCTFIVKKFLFSTTHTPCIDLGKICDKNKIKTGMLNNAMFKEM